MTAWRMYQIGEEVEDQEWSRGTTWETLHERSSNEGEKWMEERNIQVEILV